MLPVVLNVYKTAFRAASLGPSALLLVSHELLENTQ